MKFISFFAGIGGIDLGLERAGHECVGQCEIDPYALKVLAKHWPDVPRFGDITKVDPNELPEADLWAGGFPCQDISCAGKQAGITGSRSGLFFDWMRLATKVRPRYMLLENVSALINGGLSTVLGTLAACGYDAEWDCIPAQAVGAPHRRDRIFIVANTNGGSGQSGRKTNGICVFDGDQGPLISFRSNEGRTQWAVEPQVGRVANGVPCRVDRLRCLGNAVVPQVAEYIGKLLKETEK
jgi:DNA (cytosine-5)-methyltransferase 1